MKDIERVPRERYCLKERWSNERYRKGPKGALLSKRKVGAMKGTERVPRERYCLKERWINERYRKSPKGALLSKRKVEQ